LPILRRIEELYEQDQAKLDTAFNGYDKCSSKGKKIFKKQYIFNKKSIQFWRMNVRQLRKFISVV